MKIGMITDSLGELSFDNLLGTAAELGIAQIDDLLVGADFQGAGVGLDQVDETGRVGETIVAQRDDGTPGAGFDDPFGRPGRLVTMKPTRGYSSPGCRPTESRLPPAGSPAANLLDIR